MRRFIFILNYLLLIGYTHAQVLYRISGNSAAAPSYVLATNRMVDMTFIDSIPNVFACYGACNKVITEFAMQDYEAIAALRQAALLPDSVRLRNFFSQEQYDDINEALLIKLADMLYNSYDKPAEKALNRMYKNACEVLLKRKLSDECRELAQLIVLA